MERAREPSVPVMSQVARDREWRGAAMLAASGGSFSQRRLLSAVFWRELRELGGGLRFRAGLLLIVGLMASSALINAVRYRAEIRIAFDLRDEYAMALASQPVAALAAIPHPAVKPPWKLAFLVEGGQPGGINVYRQPLNPWYEPELESWQPGESLGSAEPLDWLFVIRVILSLIACVLGYDAFCGARQRALLKMVLSYPVARWQVFLAKLAAIWTCLAGPFAIGGPVSLFILVTYGGMRFSAAEWGKIASVAVLGLWASAVFALLALAVSALNRQAGRSLAILALVWVGAVVVIPAASGLAVHAMRPLKADSEVTRQLAEIRRKIERDGPGTWRSEELARQDGYAKERQAADTQNQRYRSQERLRRDLILRQLDQVERARRLASISPMALIQDSAERLVGSGPYRDRSFFLQAWLWREELAARVRALDVADPESPHVFFIEAYMSEQGFDAAAVPRFDFREAGLEDGLRRSLPLLLGLALATVALAVTVWLLFARFDVG